MLYNYEDSSFEKSEDLVGLESELAKLRKETSHLYENEYVRDFIENYHTENKQKNDNTKNIKPASTSRVSNNSNNSSNSNNSKLKKIKPYSYDNEEIRNGDVSKQRSKKKDQSKYEKNTNKHYRDNYIDTGLPIFSRKYESQEYSKDGFVTMDMNKVRGDLIRSPDRNKVENASEDKGRKTKKNNEFNLKKNKNLDFVNKDNFNYDSLSNEVFSEKNDYYANELNKGHKYKKSDEKILYYLDHSEDDNENNDFIGEVEGEIEGEIEDEQNRLKISNNFLSNLPSNDMQIKAVEELNQNERDLLMKRIQSLEVIESSQKMLILESQNKEQQYRIRCEELQKQLEYKETRLLLLNQDYEMLKRDYNLQSEEKEMIKKKYIEMETRWNEEYSSLYKYKVDYEIISKQNEILTTEKNSFITLIESDKERYRKMEMNNTSLMLNLDNLEKRNHEIVERCTKLQEDNDSLSREYNKLYQKYTSLLSEYGSSKKNEENLNSIIVELEDQNKKLISDNNFINEKYKTLSATERALEQVQETNLNLRNEISYVKEERDVLSADNKNFEKKIKSSEETIYELKNQILDYTLENQKLKKLIKQTIIPLIPESEYNSTIGHILTVLNAKENLRMSVKVLEEEYLNNTKNKNKDKNEINNEVIDIWKDIESPFSPKKNLCKNEQFSPDLNNQSLSKISKSPINEEISQLKSPKINESKIKNKNNSPKSNLSSNMRKFEKIYPVKHNIDELKTKSCIISNSNNNDKKNMSPPFKSCPNLNDDKSAAGDFKSKNTEESYKRGVSILTPRPLNNNQDSHTVPVVLPKKLEVNISKALEDEENIPIIPIDDENDHLSGKNEMSNDLSNNNESHINKIEGESCSHINDCVKMIDNYEKQILLLNVEKVQLEAELALLPTDNWVKNAKEKENRDYIERRLLEIQNSITQANSNIKNMKEKKKFKDEII